MRIYFKTETFPKLSELVNEFGSTKYSKRICQFLNSYYSTLQNISKVYGFSLVRLQFAELFVIVQRPNETTIIIEIRILE